MRVDVGKQFLGGRTAEGEVAGVDCGDDGGGDAFEFAGDWLFGLGVALGSRVGGVGRHSGRGNGCRKYVSTCLRHSGRTNASCEFNIMPL